MGQLRQWFSERWSALLLQAYRRPLGFLLVLIVLPLLLIAVVTYQVNTSVWRAQTLHNLRVTARLGAEIIGETLDESSRFTEMLAADPGLTDAIRHHDTAQLSHRLKEALAFAKHLDVAMVLTPTGSVLAASSDEPGLIGQDMSQQDAFLGAQQSGWQPYISAVYLLEQPQLEKVVGIIVPIVEQKQLLGWLQVQHRVERIKSWIQKLRVEPAGFLYVVDHHDQLVVFPFQVLPGRPKVVSDWAPVAAPVTEDGTTLVFRDAKSGARWLSGIHPVGTIGWRVVAVQPERAAFQTLYQVFGTLGVLLLIVLVLTTFVSLRWAKLHALSQHLLRQNAKLLKQFQQQRTLDRTRPSDPPKGEPHP